MLFGDFGWSSIIPKVLVDQFAWTLFYMSHVNYWTNWIVTNNMADPQCTKSSIVKYLSYDWILGLFSGYIIWIPACTIIYWFQEDLQIIVNNLIGCFFVIVMNTLTAGKTALAMDDMDKEHVEDDELGHGGELLEIETNEVVKNDD